MTVHQIIFHTDDGALAIVQGTNKEDVFKDGYARYLLMHDGNDGTYTTWFFAERLTDGGMFELTLPISNDKSMGTYKVFIHYNTFTQED